MQRIACCAIVVLLCSCSAADVPLAPDATLVAVADLHARSRDYAFTRVDLGTLGGASSFANDINNHDVVVGWSTTATGAVHAFRWSEREGMIDLGTLPGHVESQAVAILDHKAHGGWLILGSSTSANGQRTPVVWTASGVISPLPIPVLPNFATVLPTDFNERGRVVGSDVDGPGQRGWMWSERDGKVDLSAPVLTGGSEGSVADITDKGVVLVVATAAGCAFPITQCWRSHLWSRRTGYIPLGTPGNVVQVDVTASALNDHKTVVGSFSPGAPPATPFRWSIDAGFTLLPRLSTAFIDGLPTAIDDAGNAIGADSDPSVGSVVAVLWPANGGIVRLDGDAPIPGVAEAINQRGTVVGNDLGASSHAVVWTRDKTKKSRSQVMASVTRERLSDPDARCLTDIRVVSSRAARSQCLMNAARGR